MIILLKGVKTLEELKSEIEYLKKVNKELEKENYILNSELEAILNVIPGFYFSKNKNDVITRINNSFVKNLNLSKKDIIGKKPFDLFPLEQSEAFRKDDLEILKSGKPKLNIKEFADFPGGRIWFITNKVPYFDENGEVQGIIGLSVDITERMEIEEKLKESEEKYKILFEQAPDSIYLVDPETQELVEFNHKAYENLGYSKEEFTKLKVSDIEFYDTPEEILDRMKKLLIIGGAPDFETVHETKHGDLRKMYVSIAVISVLGKKYCQIICKDITNLKKIEEKLRKSEQKYREAFYTANFYKDILTHDISNILQSIVSSVDFYSSFKNYKNVQSNIGDIYQIIRFHAQRIATLISNIRILSTLQENHIQLNEVLLFKILNQAIENIKNHFPNKNIKIDIEGLSNEQKIVANELLIYIFENIINNAVIHNDNTNNIELKIKSTIKRLSEKNYLKMEFIDNGRGISNERKETLFNRSYDEDPSKRGMGLGLTLAYKIIDKYDGKIWIEDRVKGDYKKGSNFILLFRENMEV